MQAALEAAGGTRPFVKVQTTGPISFGLTIVDENKREHLLQPRVHRRDREGARR